MVRTSGTVTKGRTDGFRVLAGRKLSFCALIAAVGLVANPIGGRKATVTATPVYGEDASSSAISGTAKTTLTPRMYIPAFIAIAPAISASAAGPNLKLAILSALPLFRVFALNSPRRIALFRWQRPHAHRDAPTSKALIRSGRGQGSESTLSLSFAFSIASLSSQRVGSDDFISAG